MKRKKPTTKELWKSVYAELESAVKATPGRLLVHANRRSKSNGAIAWCKERPGVTHYLFERGSYYWVSLLCYDSRVFRLSTKTEGVWPKSRRKDCRHPFELTFAPSDLPEVATSNLVRFVESSFASEADEDVLEKLWRWPLFYPGGNYQDGGKIPATLGPLGRTSLRTRKIIERRKLMPNPWLQLADQIEAATESVYDVLDFSEGVAHARVYRRAARALERLERLSGDLWALAEAADKKALNDYNIDRSVEAVLNGPEENDL